MNEFEFEKVFQAILNDTKEKQFQKIKNMTQKDLEAWFFNLEWPYCHHPQESIEKTIEAIDFYHVREEILKDPEVIEKINKAKINVYKKWLSYDFV